jgi:nucleoside-diphosphate-sugar epimerase
MRFTVVGAGGFIGARLVEVLAEEGHDVIAVLDRSGPSEPLGHVIWAAGITSEFRQRPYDTMAAHVGDLSDWLRRPLDSFLYLSSTRVYAGAGSGREDSALRVRPEDPDHLYNISKIAGECLCLSDPRPTVRAVRLSNVYGVPFAGPAFLDTLVRSARDQGLLTLRSAASVRRDFVDVRDVVRLLPEIARRGPMRLYNLASGRSTTSAELVKVLQKATGARVHFLCRMTPTDDMPDIDISRMQRDFDFQPLHVVDELPLLLKQGDPDDPR